VIQRNRHGDASIATRLFVSSAIWTFLVLLMGGVLLSAYYRRQTQQAFDERLAVYLRALVADVANAGGDSSDEPGDLGDPQFQLVASGRYWQITRLDGDHNIRTSKSLFSAHLPKLADFRIAPGVGGARSGTVPGPDGRDLRIVERTIDAGDNGLFLVQVAATTEDVSNEVWRFEIALSVVFLLLAAGLLAATAFQVRFGLRPLRALETAVGSVRRGENNRIEGRYSRDIAPLADELNLLIAANQDIVERARVQVGNLAHALKTPLSVLTNEDPGEGMLAAKVREQAAIMRDQVAYYLDRARVAARAGAIGTTTDVSAALDGLVRTFRKIYPERTIDDPAMPGALRFLGEKQDFEEMVGNLLDNACKWSRERIDLTVTLEAGPAGREALVVCIDDDGPGVTEEKRAEALKRGMRLDETKPGSGLGLSIVRDLANAYRGEFSLDQSPRGGLRAVLRLPGAGT
jgi:signal transduction histidine kinase